MDANALDLHQVTYTTDRGDTLFRNLDLTLRQGESLVIVGAAGTGKTRLLDILIGRTFADSGSVEVLGEELRKRRWGAVRRVRRRIGGVGGPFDLIPSFTVAKNLSIPMILAGESRKVRHERLFTTLADMSLLNLAKTYPFQLTRVERTMVQLARATIANQPLVLIDEPAAGVDPATYERVFGYLTKLILSGRSLLIVSAEPPQQDLPHTTVRFFHEGTLV